MTKFNSNTMSKLNRFASNIANELIDGLKSGRIRSHGFGDKKREIKKFLYINRNFLSGLFNVNVNNILKTKKQIDFVVGLVAYKMGNIG